jgi:nicotinamidase-related amidase
MANFAMVPQRTALINVDLQNCFVEGYPISAPDGLAVPDRINRLTAVCHAAGILVVQGSCDSSLEGDGFELSVPREIGYGFGGFGPFSVAFGSPVGRDPSPKGTHPLATRN